LNSRISYNYELDYLLSLGSYLRNIKGSKEKSSDNNAMIWKEYFNSQNNTFLFNDLSVMMKSHLFQSYTAEYIEENGVKALIKLKPDDFYKDIASYIPFKKEECSTPEKLYKSYEHYIKESYRNSPEDFIVFKEIIFNHSDFLLRFQNALTVTLAIFENDIYNAQSKLTINKLIEEQIKLYESQGNDYLDNLIIFNQNSTNSPKDKIKLYLLYFANKSYCLSFDKSHLSFGYSAYEKLIKKNINADMQAFIKIISDAKRYMILKLLSERPYYGAEIAEKVGLTTATVSHHLDRIAKLKLLSVKNGINNRVYFSVNQEILESYLDSIKNDLLKY